MLVTEREAMGLVCSMARGVAGSCLGSKCMAWRWELRPNRAFIKLGTDVEVDPGRPVAVPDTWEWVPGSDNEGEAGWLEPAVEADARRQGSCGMCMVV